MSKDLWLKRIRNYAGFLGMLLPWIAILSVLLIDNRPDHSLYSISATYYLSPALAAVLTSASIVLLCYDGYSMLDNIITTTSGVFGIGIVLFPCSVGWLHGTDHVGFFQLQMHYSNYIHCFCASVFFILLAFNSYFLFTKNDGKMTEEKKKRNTIYKVCAIGMLVFMIWQAITCTFDFPGYWTMINEIFLLQFFGISWLTKGGCIFPDKKQLSKLKV